MISFGNIRGYIMEGSIPLVKFIYDRGTLLNVEILVDKSLLPCEYRLSDSIRVATQVFLEERVVPETRQGLLEELLSVGIPYYDPVALLKYNKGVSIEDNYWIKLEE